MSSSSVLLGDVCEFAYGSGLPEVYRKGGEVPVYGSNGIVGWHDEAITKGPAIIVGRKGSIGEVHLSETPCWPIDTTYYIDTTKKLSDLIWLYYTLLALDLTGLNKSAAVPGLNRHDAYEKTIPFPPLPEQKRIAAILAKADRLRRLRRYALDLSDTYLQSVFLEMFGDLYDNPKGWSFKVLGSIADVVSGVTKGRKFRDRETLRLPYLRVANVQDGYLDLEEVKTIEALPSDLERYRLEAGDVLMTEGGDFDKLGRGAIWQGQVQDCIHQNHIFRVRLDRERASAEFFVSLLLTRYAKGYFLQASKQTTNLATINKTQLRGFPVPLPPLALQGQFAHIARKFERLRAQQREAERQAEQLFQTLLHQAFQGEL